MLLGLAGIGGTLLGAVVGARGVQGAARITSRAQIDAEEQKARRQAYSACATALLARRDAVDALLEVFRAEDFDQAVVETRLHDVDAQRAAVARAVGAVAIEGPQGVAHHAEAASRATEQLAGRLRDWAVIIGGGRDHREVVQNQLEFALRDRSDAERMLDDFTAGCRKVLRPAEGYRPTQRGLFRHL